MGRLASNNFHEVHRGNFWSDYTGSDNDGNGIGDTPYHETDVLGYIVDRHPEARVFALSPAATLLRKSEEVLPLLDVQGVTDSYPLIAPTAYTQLQLQTLHPSKLLAKATQK
jgi:nitrous oxidase accessory protein